MKKPKKMPAVGFIEAGFTGLRPRAARAQTGSFMLRQILTLVFAAGVLCGCARHYVITLSNGSRITTSSKPRLQNGYYVFKDALGQDSYVGAGRVTEIAPASMSDKSGRPFISAPPK
jgi:hypothetical protein